MKHWLPHWYHQESEPYEIFVLCGAGSLQPPRDEEDFSFGPAGKFSSVSSDNQQLLSDALLRGTV